MRKSREPDYFKTPYLVRQAIRNRNSLDSIKNMKRPRVANLSEVEKANGHFSSLLIFP